MKYNSSETMRFLGKQYYDLMLTQEQYNQLQDIKKARLEDNEFNLEMMLADAYILGFINGKRSERRKRKQVVCCEMVRIRCKTVVIVTST